MPGPDLQRAVARGGPLGPDELHRLAAGVSVAQGVLLIFSASLLLACAGTWLLLRHPVPGRLQPHNPKAGARIRQELPLIAGNLVEK